MITITYITQLIFSGQDMHTQGSTTQCLSVVMWQYFSFRTITQLANKKQYFENDLSILPMPNLHLYWEWVIYDTWVVRVVDLTPRCGGGETSGFGRHIAFPWDQYVFQYTWTLGNWKSHDWEIQFNQWKLEYIHPGIPAIRLHWILIWSCVLLAHVLRMFWVCQVNTLTLAMPCCTIEIYEWISNFKPHFIMDVITYPCCD